MPEYSGEDDHGKTGGKYSRRDFLKIGGAAGLAVGLGGGLSGLAACGSSSSSTSTTSSSSTPSASATVPSSGSVVGTLPTEVQGFYELATTTPLGPSIFKDFKPKNGPPWLIGFASSFAGNSWRIGARTRLATYCLPTYKKAGLVKDVITTESNLNISTQIQQIRQLVDQGCDAIMTIGAAATALNGAIKYAYDHGVPFIAIQGGVLTPYAQTIGGNYALIGKLQTESLAKSMGEKGNVLVIQGITQAAASQDFERGHKAGLAAFPNIKVVGTVAGMWVDSVAKTAVAQFLSTHPQPINGFATQSPGDLGAMSYMLQSNRPMVPMTAGGEIGPLVYWRDHPSWISEMYQSWPPGSEMQEGWEVMLRILEGQGPKIASILRGGSPITNGDLATLLPAGATLTTNQWIDPAPGQWFTTATMDMFFERPHDPLTWKPA
jgi:ribose transport system substrate-binding protein